MDISSLPHELLLYILQYLTVDDIYTLCSINQTWNELCTDDYLWYLLVKRDFGPSYNYNPPKLKDTWEDTYLELDYQDYLEDLSWDIAEYERYYYKN